MALSRIVVAALLLATPMAATADDTAIARYSALTSIEPRCTRPASGSEIVVCAMRRADRWRVPFIAYDAGDPRGESVEGERKRISAAPKVPCGQGAIIADCGGGVGISYRTDLTPENARLRPLAP